MLAGKEGPIQSRRPVAVIAIGGNSLIRDPKHPEVEEQRRGVKETCHHLAAMIAAGWDLVITHGNGPQFGFILRRNELAASQVHLTPLDLISADTQGSIGYMVQQGLVTELARRGIVRQAVTVITQVVVDPADPAFGRPSKPIGGFMTQEEARRVAAQGWIVMEDAGRGWRRVIASPEPKRIVERDVIRHLREAGYLVIAVGGGGIPVVDKGGEGFAGIDAVIDKDKAGSLLAIEIEADLFLISTAVEKVALRYGKPDVQWLDRMTVEEAERWLAEGHFAAGSMKPKVEGAIRFVRATGRRALITDPPNLTRALEGQTGTWVVP